MNTTIENCPNIIKPLLARLNVHTREELLALDLKRASTLPSVGEVKLKNLITYVEEVRNKQDPAAPRSVEDRITDICPPLIAPLLRQLGVTNRDELIAVGPDDLVGLPGVGLKRVEVLKKFIQQSKDEYEDRPGVEFANTQHAEQQKDSTNLRDLLKKLVDLSPKYDTVIRRRANGETLEEIGSVLNLSKERVRQLERDAAEHKLLGKKARELIESSSLKKSLTLEDYEVQEKEGISLTELKVACKLAGIKISELNPSKCSLFAPDDLSCLWELVKRTLVDGTLENKSNYRLNEFLRNDSTSTQNKFSQSIINFNPTIQREDLLNKFTVVTLRAILEKQIAESGLNGISIDELNHCGFVQNDYELEQILCKPGVALLDEYELLPGGLIARLSQKTLVAQEITNILWDSPVPLTSTEIQSQGSVQLCSLQQPILCGKYLTKLDVICAVPSRGRATKYTHIAHIGLTLKEVKEVQNWGASLLENTPGRIDGKELFNQYQQSGVPHKITSSTQLVSIIQKHPSIRRLSSSEELAFKDTFDDADLFLPKTHPELAREFYSEKNSPLTASETRPTSTRILWWKCDNRHEWQQTPLSRTKTPGCPHCFSAALSDTMQASNNEVTDGDDQNITGKAVDHVQTARHIVGKDNNSQATVTESRNMISFRCECNKIFKVSEQHAGKRATCKACGRKIVIPQASASAPVSHEFSEQKDTDHPTIDAVKSEVTFIFGEGSVPGAVMFDVQPKHGCVHVTLNNEHPAQDLFSDLLMEVDEGASKALKSLQLMLRSWARLEDESSETRRSLLAEIREDWGRIARDFLKESATPERFGNEIAGSQESIETKD